MEQIESKAERTKRYVIEKVAPVFNQKGYAATSLTDLTTATGLSKGSIYGNFKNKDEVALASFEHNAELTDQAIRAKITKAATQRDKLLAYPNTFREIFETVIAIGGCPILNTSVDSCGLNEKLHAAVQRKIALWRRSLIRIMTTGYEKGEFTRSISIEQTAMVMICLVEGAYAMTKTTGDSAFLESALSQIEEIIQEL